MSRVPSCPIVSHWVRSILFCGTHRGYTKWVHKGTWHLSQDVPATLCFMFHCVPYRACTQEAPGTSHPQLLCALLLVFMVASDRISERCSLVRREKDLFLWFWRRKYLFHVNPVSVHVCRPKKLFCAHLHRKVWNVHNFEWKLLSYPWRSQFTCPGFSHCLQLFVRLISCFKSEMGLFICANLTPVADFGVCCSRTCGA